MDIARTQIYIFIGNNQQKIPVDLVIQTQRLNDAVKWIKIEGQGRNALDFHIAFMLGTLNQDKEKDIEFKILSKDAGFDPLVLYINNLGRKCVRITSISRQNEDSDFSSS